MSRRDQAEKVVTIFGIFVLILDTVALFIYRMDHGDF